MAQSTGPDIDNMLKLRRFLYFGHNNGFYPVGKPGRSSLSATLRKFASSDTEVYVNETNVVRDVLAGEGGEKVLEAIKAFLQDSSTGVSREPALFALAVCSLYTDPEPDPEKVETTRKTALKLFATLCNSTQDFVTFIIFRKNITEKKKGWGRSIRKAVGRWFDIRDSKTLAKIVTKQKTALHWSIQDILRMTHIAPKTEGAKMIVKYLIKGLKVTTEEFGGEKGDGVMSDTLVYLEAVEKASKVKLDSETDRAAAESAVDQVVELVDSHQLSLQQVHAFYLKKPQVLAVLAKHMSVTEVIENIGFLAANKALEPTFAGASDIAQIISSSERIKEEKVSVVTVLIANRVYEKGCVAKQWSPNNSVKEALNSAFVTALEYNVSKTGQRCLMAMNVNQQFSTSWVHGSKVLPAAVAAASWAQVLARTETGPVLAAFNTHVKPLTLNNALDIQQIAQVLTQECAAKEGSKSLCDMAAPVTWATEEKKPFDVIIIMTDFRHPKAFTDLPAAFKKYRETLGLPSAKLVCCGLTACHVSLADSTDPGMMDIGGFDATVPHVIHKFTTDAL